MIVVRRTKAAIIYKIYFQYNLTHHYCSFTDASYSEKCLYIHIYGTCSQRKDLNHIKHAFQFTCYCYAYYMILE